MTTTGFAAGAYAATKQMTARAAGMAAGAASPIGAAGATGSSFGQLLSDAIGGVSQAGHKAEAQALSAASGKTNLVDVVTAVAESETALQSLVAVRDRMIAAYEEIMRMQV
jgi:flagellar hook-basal body complex protein FliE